MTTTTPRPRAANGLRGRLVSLAERVTTPLLPADYLDAIDPLLSGAHLRGRIVGIHPETRDAVTVVIPGARNAAQAKANAAAAELEPLNIDVMTAAREVYDRLVAPHVHQRW